MIFEIVVLHYHHHYLGTPVLAIEGKQDGSVETHAYQSFVILARFRIKKGRSIYIYIYVCVCVCYGAICRICKRTGYACSVVTEKYLSSR
jgi:hypothetical protein